MFWWAYAHDTITVYPREALSPIPFFKGARARGNLFIENKRAGTLYLRFHFRRDDIDKSKGTGPPTWQLSNEDGACHMRSINSVMIVACGLVAAATPLIFPNSEKPARTRKSKTIECAIVHPENSDSENL
jgi:hypothetical protein